MRGARCLSFTKRGKGFWSNDDKSEINITKSMLVGMIEYLVDNIYVSVGSTVFRQCVGIPTYGHCWPIYIYFILNTHMKEQLKSNMTKAKRFSNTFCY